MYLTNLATQLYVGMYAFVILANRVSKFLGIIAYGPLTAIMAMLAMIDQKRLPFHLSPNVYSIFAVPRLLVHPCKKKELV